MFASLSLDFNSCDISKILITKDRFFVLRCCTSFDDVPTVKYTEDDYYETIERQCVETSDFVIAITDNLEQAKNLRDMKIKEYNEHLKEQNLSEEYGYTRYIVVAYNEFNEMFDVFY